MNWQVLAQLISIGAVLLAGPAVVVLLALNNGNL
tara:strand:+ start:435 stop:536 length:102 start_codon:yes stop_codon:yes gene_type:complete